MYTNCSVVRCIVYVYSVVYGWRSSTFSMIIGICCGFHAMFYVKSTLTASVSATVAGHTRLWSMSIEVINLAFVCPPHSVICLTVTDADYNCILRLSSALPVFSGHVLQYILPAFKWMLSLTLLLVLVSVSGLSTGLPSSTDAVWAVLCRGVRSGFSIRSLYTRHALGRCMYWWVEMWVIGVNGEIVTD